MPDPRQISGVPLPASDLPAGTVSVRVIRGTFANNLAGVDVAFVVDGKTTVVKTDAGGRAQLSGIAPGSTLVARATVDGEALESQTIPIGAQGIRLVLAAADPGATARDAENKALAASQPVRGAVVLGQESRIVAEFSNDRLNLYYALKIENTARTPVDLGGPLVIELPQGARGVSMLQDSSPQARPSGSHVVVTGPFAPGTTAVNIGFELPYDGPTAAFEQRFPAPLEQLSVFMLKTGAMDLSSPQLQTKQTVTQQGEQIVVGSGGAVAAGQPIAIEISGLLYHAQWPRFLALALAGTLVTLGIVGAFGRATRRGGASASRTRV
jgi:hypothetical protein